MIFGHVDDLAAAYFAGMERLTSVPALDLRMITAEVCAGCGGGPSTRRVGRYVRSRLDATRRLAEWETVCASCGAPWDPEPWGSRCVLRGEIQVSARPGATEDATHARLELWRRLRAVMEPRPNDASRDEWARALWCWQAWLHPSCGSCRLVADAAAAAGRPMGSAERIERRLRAARHTVEARARRREHGLMVPYSRARLAV